MAFKCHLRPFLAWFGAKDLFSHAWKFLGLGRCEVDLNFHKPLKFRDFSNRKVACEYAFKLISGQILRNNNSKEVSKVIKLLNFAFTVSLANSILLIIEVLLGLPPVKYPRCDDG